MLYINYLDKLNYIVDKKLTYLYGFIDLKNNDKKYLNNYSKYAYFSRNHLLLTLFCLIALLNFLHVNYFVEATTSSSIDNINQNSIINSGSLNQVNKNNIGENHASCNCVVFRMDDIQDYWLNSVEKCSNGCIFKS